MVGVSPTISISMFIGEDIDHEEGESSVRAPMAIYYNCLTYRCGRVQDTFDNLKMTFMGLKPLLLLISLSLFKISSVYAQGYIDLTKKKALEKLQENRNKIKNIHINISETDSTLAYSIRDSAMQNLDFTLFFDKNGKCYRESNILSCDSCYQKFLGNVLSNKYFRWTKIDSNTYFARFPYHLILTTNAGKDSFEIRRSDLIGKEYRRLVNRAISNK